MKKTFNKKNSLISDIIIFGAGSLGSKLIMFLLVPLYTNILTPSEYGIADLVITAAELLIPIVSVVIFEALLRYGLDANYYNRKDVLLSAMIVCVLGSILMVLVTPFFSFYASISSWKWYMCVYVVVYQFYSIEMMYLKVCNRNMLYAVLSCIQTLILAIINLLLLVVLRWGIKGYLLSIIISHLLITGYILLFGGIVKDLKKSKFSKRLFLEMVLYSCPLILNNLSWWVIHSSDKLMIEKMLGSAPLGVYTVSLKISTIISLVVGVFSQAWSLSSIKAQESQERESYYAKVFEWYSFLCFIGAIFIISISKWFMKIYVGQEFLEAASYVPLLIVASFFSAITAFYSRLFSVVKKNNIVMITTVVAASLNIITNYIFVRKIGIWGAVLGTVVAYITMLLLQMLLIRKYLQVKIHRLVFICSCILLFVAALANVFNFYVVPVNIVCIFAVFAVRYKLVWSVLCNFKKKNIKKD